MTIYYVDIAGLDSNTGLQDKPWKSIQKAANYMIAGDTVIVQAGNYAAQRVQVSRSGNSNATITFQANGKVIMKGFSVQANNITIRGFEIAYTDYVRWNTEISAGIYIKGSNNIIEDCYIHDGALGGIHIFGTPGEPTISSNNIIRNNQLYRNEMCGITVNGRNNLIEGNEVWGTVQCHPTLTAVEDNAVDNPNHLACPMYPGVTGLDADGMRFFGQGHVFRKNYIHDISCGPSGLNPVDGDYNDNPHIDCFQTWSGTNVETAQNIIFEQNYCENLNLGMYAFMLNGGANHLIIRNNIIRSYGGINTGQSGQHHLYIFNNLWINDLSFKELWPSAVGLKNAPYSQVINNIFYDQPYHTITAIGDTTGQVIDYNLAFNSNGSIPDCMRVGDYVCTNPPTAHNKWNVDPGFVNPDTNNYHVKANSPAINAGFSLSDVINDFDDNIRPKNGVYGIGPYEFIPETSSSSSSKSSSRSISSSVSYSSSVSSSPSSSMSSSSSVSPSFSSSVSKSLSPSSSVSSSSSSSSSKSLSPSNSISLSVSPSESSSNSSSISPSPSSEYITIEFKDGIIIDICKRIRPSN